LWPESNIPVPNPDEFDDEHGLFGFFPQEEKMIVLAISRYGIHIQYYDYGFTGISLVRQKDHCSLKEHASHIKVVTLYLHIRFKNGNSMVQLQVSFDSLDFNDRQLPHENE
jgi:hypothetical protein